jgi:hypothetical protein
MKISFIEVLIVLAIVLVVHRFYQAKDCHSKGGVLWQTQCVRVNLIE